MLLTGVAFLAGCAATHQSELPMIEMANTSQPHSLATVKVIPELMQAFDVSGLAVTAVSFDEVLLADGFGVTQSGEPFLGSTSCGLFSATKVLASLTYVNLSERGLLDLDTPLGSLIDDAPAHWQAIPFYSLLNHTSGITMVVTRDEFNQLAQDPAATNADVYRLIRNQPLDYDPGQFSRYRQSGYAIGEMILENRLQLDFASLVEEFIVEPAGLSSTGHPAVGDPDKPNILLSAGGYQTTAEDMAKLLLAINDGVAVSPNRLKDVLLDEKHLFFDYSLGSVIEYDAGVLTVGHSGGGARANIRYAPDERVGVMVCTDDQTNDGLAFDLARTLIREITSGEMPGLPLTVALTGYAEMTGEQVIAALTEAEAEDGRFDLSQTEGLLNQIGYVFLSQGRTRDAVHVLAFNAQRFPRSPNVYDSLGEALLAAGDREAALENYRRVLELDPGNENATVMVAKILAMSSENALPQ